MAAGPDAVLKQGPEAVLEVAMLPETRGNILAKVIMGEAVTVAGADGLSAVRRANARFELFRGKSTIRGWIFTKLHQIAPF